MLLLLLLLHSADWNSDRFVKKRAAMSPNNKKKPNQEYTSRQCLDIVDQKTGSIAIERRIQWT